MNKPGLRSRPALRRPDLRAWRPRRPLRCLVGAAAPPCRRPSPLRRSGESPDAVNISLPGRSLNSPFNRAGKVIRPEDPDDERVGRPTEHFRVPINFIQTTRLSLRATRPKLREADHLTDVSTPRPLADEVSSANRPTQCPRRKPLPPETARPSSSLPRCTESIHRASPCRFHGQWSPRVCEGTGRRRARGCDHPVTAW